jgi:hypothetical protein
MKPKRIHRLKAHVPFLLAYTKMVHVLGLIALLAALCCTACGNKDFDENGAVGLARVKAIKLDGEQVVLSEKQIACGVLNELWEEPNGDRKTVPILAKGQALNFYGDVVVDDGALGSHTQVRGDFTLEPVLPLNIREPKEGVKLVTGRAGVNVMQSCFANSPLPLMGVRHGEFSPDAPVQMRYIFNGKDWEIDAVLH